MTDSLNSTSFVNALGQFTDPYERYARLYPALIAILPFVVMILTLYQESLSLLHLGFIAVLSCGGLFLLADIARRRGKMKEKRLWQRWGGLPSTQVLRHRDDYFDSISKVRYHQILAEKIGQRFPSKTDEENDPLVADSIYTAAGNFLRNATRDKKKYALLFNDNVSYGFRRNGYGLRTIGIFISLLCLLWVFIRADIYTWDVRFKSSPNIESIFNFGEWSTIVISICMILVWAFVFTESAVREAAFSYAKNLILSCESLN
ncbi:TPA: hypothetical protein P5L69_003413 [Salmonella enterica subsp. enterica serovar Concord]|nr:hypothetical protein [Salmonella enterica subsp. enterica serovar Epalinges]ECH6936908.1 hypothetical protein [Salmonella enterica subsp. enterica serovar Epalinges]ECQ7054182.1 hypothetical protein [Salmonella enterica subsp. enterica serovar Epalinges]EDD2901807.1 hypothetical protein [Salmonella enterica subsp. enterica serovar Epalinges]HDO8381594.1 hypothetical protein [Salmonella enterica subsp. enterica serovar Concord]